MKKRGFPWNSVRLVLTHPLTGMRWMVRRVARKLRRKKGEHLSLKETVELQWWKVVWRRWRRLERDYLQALATSELMRTARLVGKPEPVELDKTYAPPRLAPYRPAYLRSEEGVTPPQDEPALLDWQALARSHRIVILGEAGAGKSTLVKHVVGAMALPRPSWNEFVRQVFPPGHEFPLPLYLEVDRISDGSGSLIQDILTQTRLPDFFRNEAALYLKNMLHHGLCLIVLDGFTEASPEARRALLDRLAVFQQEIGPANHITLTSRTAGYLEGLQGFTELEILPFSPYQVQVFLNNWFSEDQAKIDDLTRALDVNSRLAELASTPLLLATIAFIYELGLRDPQYRLPERKVELYRVCTLALLDKWAEISNKPWRYHFPEPQKRHILETLAYGFHCDRIERCQQDDIRVRLREALDRTPVDGLNLHEATELRSDRRSGSDEYNLAAVAELIQNAFTAKEFRRFLQLHSPFAPILNKVGPDASLEDTAEVAIQYCQKRRLLTELLAKIKVENKPQYERHIDAISHHADSSSLDGLLREIHEQSGILYQDTHDTLRFIHLTFQEYFAACYLARMTQAESLLRNYVSDPWWHDVIVLLAGIRRDATQIIDAVLEKKPWTVTRLLLAVRCLRDAIDTPASTRRMVIDPLVDWLLTKQEYRGQEYRGSLQDLGAILEDTDWEKILHLLEEPEPKQRAVAVELLGVLAHKKQVPKLIDLLEDGAPEVCLASVNALRHAGRAAILPLITVLEERNHSQKRQYAVEILGQSQDPRVVSPLIATVKDPDLEVARKSILALGHLGEAAVEPLIALLLDNAAEMGEATAIALGMIGRPAILPLIKALDRENEAIRYWATEALARMGRTALEAMLDCLGSKDHWIRRAAAHVLGYSGAVEAVEPLIAALADKVPVVCEEAIAALVRLESVSKELLAQTLTGKTSARLRLGAARALSGIGDPQAVPVLISASQDKDAAVRQIAVETLAQWPDDEVLVALLRRLKDKRWAVRAAAARSLGQLGQAEAVAPLCATLKDRNWQVVVAAVGALAALGDPSTALCLVSQLEKKTWQVRQAAIRGLKTLKDFRAIAPLIQALGDDDVYEDAIETLVAYGSDAVAGLIAALSPESSSLGRNVVRVITQVEDGRVIAPLKGLLGHPEVEVRMLAVQGLGQSDAPEVVSAVVTMLEDEASKVRRTAAQILGRAGNVLAVEPLCRALNLEQNRDWQVRQAAAEALGRICDPSVASVLRQALDNDRSPGVRAAAATALGQVAGCQAREALLQAQLDPDPAVARAAELALKAL